MQNRLEDKLSMFEKVDSFLQINLSVLSTKLPILSTVYPDFKQKLDNVLMSAQASTVDTTGYTADKANKRKGLEQLGLKISRGLAAYAAISQNIHLRAKIDFNKSELERMRDNDVYMNVKVIEDYAGQYITHLAPYGVPSTDLSDLTHKLKDFYLVIQTPKMKIEERSSYFQQLEEQIIDADIFLKNVIDALIGVLEVDEPLLFSQYKKARSIDQTGSQSSAKTFSGSVNANNTAVVATLVYDIDRTFTFKNTGNTSLFFGLSIDGIVSVGTEIEVVSASEITRDSSDMFSEGDKLLVRNDSAVVGNYVVNTDM